MKFMEWRKEQEEHLKFVKANVFEIITPFSLCIAFMSPSHGALQTNIRMNKIC